MKISKTKKRVLIVVLSIVLGFSIYFYAYNTSYFNEGENGYFDVNTGDQFDIKLYSNGSTGYQNIWINPEEADCIKLNGRSYWQHFWTLLLIGSGGRTTYTFKAFKAGTDTIKMASCPPKQINKDGIWIKDSSVRADHIFIVKVTE